MMKDNVQVKSHLDKAFVYLLKNTEGCYEWETKCYYDPSIPAHILEVWPMPMPSLRDPGQYWLSFEFIELIKDPSLKICWLSFSQGIFEIWMDSENLILRIHTQPDPNWLDHENSEYHERS
jgi:hypothetical protein